MDFKIKGSGGELLKITVMGYSCPDAVDFWDGNWLDCRLNLGLNGFYADFAFGLRADELERFLRELEQLHSNLKGTASLENMSCVIHLNVTIRKTGQLIWEGRLVYPAGHGTTLEFEVESDQSFLPDLINELKSIANRYPIRGK